jgi:hypothetical protein
MIKKNMVHSTIKKIQILQMAWFIYFRIYWFSILVYEYYFIFEDRLMPNILMIIYFMGYIWGAGQMKSLCLDDRRPNRTIDGKKNRERIMELKGEDGTNNKTETKIKRHVAKMC